MTQSAEISKAQKRLLKIVNCVFQQYVVCKTPATQIFFANPQDTLEPNTLSLPYYTNMKSELTAIQATIQSLPVIMSLSTNLVLVQTRIVAWNAAGVVAFDSSKIAADNTYAKFVADTVNTDNFNVLKGSQVLNTNEAAMLAYQIKPSLSCVPLHGTHGVNSIDTLWTTEASVYERIGTNGPSNTGFLRLSVEVDITAYPFNPNTCGNCIGAGDDSSSCF